MPESNVISRTTHTNYGSDHWFNTLISRQKALAELLQNEKLSDEQLKTMANCLYETTQELIEGWHIMQKVEEDMKLK